MCLEAEKPVKEVIAETSSDAVMEHVTDVAEEDILRVKNALKETITRT